MYQKLSEDQLKSLQLTNLCQTLLKFYLLKRTNKDLLNDLLLSHIGSCMYNIFMRLLVTFRSNYLFNNLRNDWE